MLSNAKIELLYILLDGGRIEAARTYPMDWRHRSFEKVPEGKPPIEKPVGEAMLIDLTERGLVLGKFTDLGGNEHRIAYTLTARGRDALIAYEDDPANAEEIRKRERRRERQRKTA